MRGSESMEVRVYLVCSYDNSKMGSKRVGSPRAGS